MVIGLCLLLVLYLERKTSILAYLVWINDRRIVVLLLNSSFYFITKWKFHFISYCIFAVFTEKRAFCFVLQYNLMLPDHLWPSNFSFFLAALGLYIKTEKRSQLPPDASDFEFMTGVSFITAS